MYWFGQNLDRPWQDSQNWKELQKKRLEFSKTPLNRILEVLDGFSSCWKEGSELFEEAKRNLEKESGFSAEEVRKTLALLPEILKRQSLEKRLRAEFSPLSILDDFSKTTGFRGKVRALPLGTVLHVTAGNVFLSSIDSLVMGLITKNLSILKVSSQNTFFPLFFAQELKKFDAETVLADKFAVLHWKGGDTETEAIFKKNVDGIIAWGGEEMISSYKKDLPATVKLLEFGPKVSLQVISKEGLAGASLELVAEKIVADIVPWDQSACASPQNLYLEEGIDEKALLRALEAAFGKASPGGALSDDEAVEILKEKYRGLYSELMEGGKVSTGPDFLLHLEEDRFLRPSPLHRSLIIKRFTDENDLFEHLVPFKYYLQSCSYLLGESEKGNFLNLLAMAGIKRFAPLGTVTWGMEGAPHDGKQVLRELTSLVGDELRHVELGKPQGEPITSAVLKSHFDSVTHPEGYIFSSGGTTGEPKFVHFSVEEFDYITDMLAENFQRQGLKAGMTVANLFVAGNLWSSFMAVEKALTKLGVVQLPIGGLCEMKNINLYLKKFRPDVVMGIPSMLVLNAESMEAQGEAVTIPMVFYAGEALSETRRTYLRKVWKTEYFGSAGYASVDAGIIGYQCAHSVPGEHHLFSDLVDLKIVDGEAVVTSLFRTTMPIKNYRTGDKVEWIGPCDCGSPDPRFRLLGRTDSTILIWSCRIPLEDLEKGLKFMNEEIMTFQVTIEQIGARETMTLSYECASELDGDVLTARIFARSRDLKDTITLEQFRKNFFLKRFDHGGVPRNARTGKVSQVRDLRT